MENQTDNGMENDVETAAFKFLQGLHYVEA